MGVLDCELFGLDLKCLERPLGCKSFRALQGQFGSAKPLLGHSDFAQNGVAFCLIGALEILLLGDGGLANQGLTADDSRFCGANYNPLILGLLIESGRVQLTELVPLLDQGTLKNHIQDRSATRAPTFDFAFDFVVLAALDFALLKNDVVERSAHHFVKHWLTFSARV